MIMAYTRTTWVNEETPLNADNMNNLEDGVEEAIAGSTIDSTVVELYTDLGLITGEGA